jgi:RNA polymerase sigma-70 factor (ECF subfamily)
MSHVGPAELGQVLDRHGSALVLYARQWCDSPEDVVQEALLRWMRQQPPPQRPVAWLYRVVRNAAMSAVRSATRRQRHETKAAAEQTWFVAPEGLALDAQTATAALAELPLDQRETIVARLWGELTFDEIAELTGVTSSTAHRRYVAGLTELRERLGVPWPETTSPDKNP